MQIGICGFGQMGRALHRLAPESGHEVAAIIDPVDGTAQYRDVAELPPNACDVVIDFTTPEAAPQNILKCCESRIPIVVGTTGWYDRMDELKAAVEEARIGIFYASNFSLGVNLFRRIVKRAAELIDRFETYDIAVHETHHTKKADSPSGTALTIAGDILNAVSRKQEILRETSHGQIPPNALHVTSARIGAVPGEHRIVIDSAFDTITLTHAARSRDGFALGALEAARWIRGKQGVFTMDDMLAE